MLGKQNPESIAPQIHRVKHQKDVNKWLWLQISMSVLVFALFSLMRVQYQTQRSNQYFELVFQRMDETLANLGYSNAKLARLLESSLKDDVYEPIDQLLIDRLQIRTYSDRNEYGFNQGIYPNTPVNGTLIGFGQPDPRLNFQKQIFYKLDRIWSYSDTKTRFNDKFFSNYDFQYVYSANLVKPSERGVMMRNNLMSKNRYRYGLQDLYLQDLSDRGFFFTYPYENILKKNIVISVISPVYLDGHLVGDLGVDLDVAEFDQFFFLHPDFQGKVDIKLLLRASENSLNIVNLDSTTLSFHVSRYQYQLPYLGTLEVDYGLTFYLSQLSYFWLALILALSIINYAICQAVVRHEESRHLYKQLNQDPMTKLYNRRVIDDIKVKIYCNVQKEFVHPYLSPPVGLVLIDANKFKQINDTYGHHIGDNAILLIAEALKASTREQDFCIRMGGDEFLIIISEASEGLLSQISERIHAYLAEKKLSGTPNGLRVSVTIAGDVILDDECFESAYLRIDKMLYENKAKLKQRD